MQKGGEWGNGWNGENLIHRQSGPPSPKGKASLASLGGGAEDGAVCAVLRIPNCRFYGAVTRRMPATVSMA